MSREVEGSFCMFFIRVKFFVYSRNFGPHCRCHFFGSVSLARLQRACFRWALRSVFDVDPMDLPWVHVFLGGACCQPFSRIGKQLGWRDDRAYTTLRMLHNTAAMRPWVLVSKNVEAQRNIHDGKVWELITGVLRILGCTVQPVPVCPSR